MTFRRYRPAFAVALMSALLGAAAPAAAQAGAGQAPAGQAPMKMANMDHRGGIRGTVRGANNAPVADTAVTAVDTTTGARFEAMTDAQGAYAFAALPVGSYNITVVSAGLTAFSRQGVAVAADQNVQLDITLDAASAAQAADAERQELLQQVADLEAARHRPRIEHGAVGAGNARPARRGVRRRERPASTTNKCRARSRP